MEGIVPSVDGITEIMSERCYVMEYIIENEKIYRKDETGKVIAEITFPVVSAEGAVKVFCIDHTFVDDSLRGQGVAGELVQLAVNKIQAQQGKIMATCSYAKHWLEKREMIEK